jgi:hypothetical protein
MHYVHNSWFLMNWTIMVFILSISTMVIAYVNNKMRLLRKATFIMIVSLILSCISVFDCIHVNTPHLQAKLQSEVSKSEVKSSGESLVSKVIHLVFSLARNKVAE